MGWSSKCRGWCQRTASTRRFWPPGGASAHSTSISSGHASAARRRVGSACPTWPPAARPGGDRVLPATPVWRVSGCGPRSPPGMVQYVPGEVPEGRTALASCPLGRLPVAPFDLPDMAPIVHQAGQLTRLSRRQWFLTGLRLPTLVIHGDKDDNVPYQHSEAATQALPGAPLVTVTGGDTPRRWSTAQPSRHRGVPRTARGGPPPALTATSGQFGVPRRFRTPDPI